MRAFADLYTFEKEPLRSCNKDIYIMITRLLCLLFVLDALAPLHAFDVISPVGSMVFFDGHQFDVIGKLDGEKNYVRFPARYKNAVRESVWKLSRDSAGISIRFRTNAIAIVVKWTVMNDADLQHMPSTGVKGVDLYAFNGKHWQYMRTGIPRGKVNEYVLMSDGDGEYREYLLNLPLYDGVDSLQMGVNPGAEITTARERLLLDKKPIVYYGTSIAQGGVLQGPASALPTSYRGNSTAALLILDSGGNGTMETSVGEAMCEADAALYVIDCNPNTPVELIYERTVALVEMLKTRKPEIPVLLVGGFINESFFLVPHRM
jgi:hypothetical protein